MAKAKAQTFNFRLVLEGEVTANTIEQAEQLLDSKFVISNDANMNFTHQSTSFDLQGDHRARY